MSEIKFDDREIKKLIKKFSATMPSVLVGILGEKTARPGELKNNAEIGMDHEFGTTEVPMRSFLRVPIQEDLHHWVEKMAENKNLSIEEMANSIGMAAVGCVEYAFASGGSGKWPRTKAEGDPLIDTSQLMGSIDYEVVT